MSRRRGLPDPSGEWRDDDVLRDLYVERGWSAPDIAEYFDEATSCVRGQLDRRGIQTPDKQRPTNGLAAKLWEGSITEKKEAAHGD